MQRPLKHLSRESHCTFLQSVWSSFSFLKEQAVSAGDRLENPFDSGHYCLDPTLQNAVVDNTDVGSSEIPAYDSRRLHDHRSCLHHLRKRLRGHRYLHVQNSVVNNKGFGFLKFCCVRVQKGYPTTGLVFGSITFRGASIATRIFTFNSFMSRTRRREQPC